MSIERRSGLMLALSVVLAVAGTIAGFIVLEGEPGAIGSMMALGGVMLSAAVGTGVCILVARRLPMKPLNSLPLSDELTGRTASPPGSPMAAHVVLSARSLLDIDYVVFDTETTGLRPTVDDLVAIAGVRVVKGEIRRRETFERLIDPGRPIPAASTRIHGITDLMVKGMPPARVVLPQFHDFAKGAVLIAHNAAFDLAFLARREAESGVAFDNPVLDTLLLSRFLDPRESDHSLDALAVRCGVAVVGRHTAWGDAEATAAVFVRLLDRMAARGVTTFEAAHRACGAIRPSVPRLPVI